MMNKNIPLGKPKFPHIQPFKSRGNRVIDTTSHEELDKEKSKIPQAVSIANVQKHTVKGGKYASSDVVSMGKLKVKSLPATHGLSMQESKLAISAPQNSCPGGEQKTSNKCTTLQNDGTSSQKELDKKTSKIPRAFPIAKESKHNVTVINNSSEVSRIAKPNGLKQHPQKQVVSTQEAKCTRNVIIKLSLEDEQKISHLPSKISIRSAEHHDIKDESASSGKELHKKSSNNLSTVPIVKGKKNNANVIKSSTDIHCKEKAKSIYNVEEVKHCTLSREHQDLLRQMHLSISSYERKYGSTITTC